MADPAPTKLACDDQAAAVLCKTLRLEGFYPEFTKDQVRGVFPHGGLNLYPKGFRLISQGDEGRDLFVIYAGKVEVIRPFVMKEIFLGPGDMFGEMAIVRDGKRNATVVAQVDSQIFYLPYQDLQYLMANNPSLSQHFSDLAYHRLG